MRDQEIILFVGKKKVGKTTFILELTRHAKNVVVISTFPHEAYTAAGFKHLPNAKLAGYKGGRVMVYDEDPEMIIQQVRKYVRNAVVIFEDSTKYILSTVSKDVRGIIIDHRNIGIDLFFTFHSLPNVPPFIATNYNKMVLFKTGQKEIKQSAVEKFPNYYEVLQDHTSVENNSNPFYKQVLEFQ